MLRTSAGRFLSPLDDPGDNVNTYPVLATPEDDAVLGAAIVLPDHPQIAPESRGNLFDDTEIEEALLLHVHALSDAERDEIAQQDPAVREMIERAAATTPEDIMRLHGRVTMRDPRAGEQEVTVDGVTSVAARRWCCARTRSATPTTACSTAARRRSSGIYLDYDDRCTWRCRSTTIRAAT